ncbi:hypothetical protein [Pontiella sulfatireligans]|uniref:Uncharacterized protein n=1 Tax=Pontiella sulfatireligans TaxID=2750658 RepID=A0A6C2UUS6_9BACT|nr:hypothetical protein [Pontiella sulfatireligans]VGO23131.1 hypothetical protein SCARR_05236 [Pontiella sulfatireligans]
MATHRGITPVASFMVREVLDNDSSPLVDYRDNRTTRGFNKFCKDLNKRMDEEDVDVRIDWRSIPLKTIRKLLVYDKDTGELSTSRLDRQPAGSIDTSVHMNAQKGRHNDGGRLWAPGYQNIKREIRRYLTINGEPTVEVDMQANWARLVYAKRVKKQYTGDPYSAVVNSFYDGSYGEDVRGILRDWVKLTMIKMFSVSSRQKAKDAATRTPPYKTWAQPMKDIVFGMLGNPRAVGDAIVSKVEEVHPELVPWFYVQEGWKCQALEGFIARGILEECLLTKPKGEGIVTLVEHDGFITAERNASQLSLYILKVYKECFGNDFYPVLTCKKVPQSNKMPATDAADF